MVGAKDIKIVFSLEFRAGTRPQDLWPFLISETGNPAKPGQPGQLKVNWTHMERPPVPFRCLTRTSRSMYFGRTNLRRAAGWRPHEL